MPFPRAVRPLLAVLLAALLGATVPVLTANAADAQACNTKWFRQGMSHPCVKDLQSKLNQKTGSGLTVGGYFGPATKAQVVKFQRSRNLAVDGVVGPQTWNALNGGGTSTAPAPSPAAATASRGPAIRECTDTVSRVSGSGHVKIRAVVRYNSAAGGNRTLSSVMLDNTATWNGRAVSVHPKYTVALRANGGRTEYAKASKSSPSITAVNFNRTYPAAGRPYVKVTATGTLNGKPFQCSLFASI